MPIAILQYRDGSVRSMWVASYLPRINIPEFPGECRFVGFTEAITYEPAKERRFVATGYRANSINLRDQEPFKAYVLHEEGYRNSGNNPSTPETPNQ